MNTMEMKILKKLQHTLSSRQGRVGKDVFRCGILIHFLFLFR